MYLAEPSAFGLEEHAGAVRAELEDRDRTFGRGRIDPEIVLGADVRAYAFERRRLYWDRPPRRAAGPAMPARVFGVRPEAESGV
jgi:hypothetical protein